MVLEHLGLPSDKHLRAHGAGLCGQGSRQHFVDAFADEFAWWHPKRGVVFGSDLDESDGPVDDEHEIGKRGDQLGG